MKHLIFPVLIILSVWTSSYPMTNPKLQRGIELIDGMKKKRTIKPTEEHTYYAELKNGMAVLGQVQQIGIDLVIDVKEPGGRQIKQLDSPNGDSGLELIDFTAFKDGMYQFIVRSLDQDVTEGSYELEVQQILAVPDNARRKAKQELPTSTLFRLWEDSFEGEEAIEAFIDKQPESHIIEDIDGDDEYMLVTYFCQPGKNTEYVMLSGGPDFMGLRFQRLAKTSLYFVTQRVPKDAWFDYGFNYFKLYQAGSQGEVMYRDVEHAYDGTVRMPNAPQADYSIVRPQIAKGKLEQKVLPSIYMEEDRILTVHTPATYDPQSPHELLIIFDGESYGGRVGRRARIPAPTILDNLNAEHRMVQTVTVLVWNMGKRSRDLISDNFAAFIGKEVIPWARENYNISTAASAVTLAGSSRGGFAASNIAFKYPQLIGNVLSQSGAYYINGTDKENHWIYPETEGKLIKAYKNSAKLPIRFYMDIGLYDAGASMLGMNRAFRDVLQAKDYDLDYREFKGGHSYINWNVTFADGLLSLLGNDR